MTTRKKPSVAAKQTAKAAPRATGAKATPATPATKAAAGSATASVKSAAKSPVKPPAKSAVKPPAKPAVKPPPSTPAPATAIVTPAEAPATRVESVAAAARPELSATAAAIVAEGAAPGLVGQQAEMLLDARAHVASQAANVIAQVFSVRPELLVPHVSKLAKAIVSKNKRVVQVAADAMPNIAKFAPARVARELDYLRGAFRFALEEGQDGLVRTFATLCIASVAYQKRLEPVLTEALSIAEGKTLLRWTQAVLPSLKGEPHARARAVVEARLESLQRPVAQPIADFLGIKLRPRR